MIARQGVRAALGLAAKPHCNTETAPSQPSRGTVWLLFAITSPLPITSLAKIPLNESRTTETLDSFPFLPASMVNLPANSEDAVDSDSS